MANQTLTPDAPVTAGAPEPPAARPVRIGAVSYLNTLPLIEGLEKLRGVEFTLSAPSGLIELLLSGRVDVALAPVIDAQRAPQALALLPVGIIGCDGPTMTVRLYSVRPFQNIKRLHVDVDSHTSVALARVLLKKQFGAAPEVVEFDTVHRSGASAEREWPEAMLLIGDKVVADAPPEERYPHQLDLGEAWKELTGLPFVYAAWMCRADEANSPAIREAAVVLDRQRRHNAMRLDWIAAKRGPEHGWTAELASTYLGAMLRYEVGERERRAVDAFYDAAAELGLIETRRPTMWAEL